MVPLDGFFQVESECPFKNNTFRRCSFQKCLLFDACKERAWNETCARPHRGPLCALCESGYGATATFKCEECKGFGAQVAGYTGFLLCMGLAVGVLSGRTIAKAESETDYQTGSNANVKIFMLAVGYFQVASLLRGNLNQ